MSREPLTRSREEIDEMLRSAGICVECAGKGCERCPDNLGTRYQTGRSYAECGGKSRRKTSVNARLGHRVTPKRTEP